MLSKAEYNILTSYINLTREHLERENDALERLQSVILELKEECGEFHPFLNSCLRTFQRLSSVLSPYDFYEASKRLYTGDAGGNVYGFIFCLEEMDDNPYVKELSNTIKDYRSFFIRITKREELVNQFFIEYDRLYGSLFNSQFFNFGFQMAAILNGKE